jgi:O-antigen ligase
MATVALAPLPFGSTGSVAVAFWCIVLGGALACANPAGLGRGHYALLGIASIVMAGCSFVLHEQVAQKPWIASYHPIWEHTSELLRTSVVPSASVARSAPWAALAGPVACALALIISFILGADREWARKLLQTIAWSGLCYAIYGIGAYLLDPTHILWREKQAYLTSMTATFVNRNTAAIYFGTCAIVWLLLFLKAIRRRLPAGPVNWRRLTRRAFMHTSPKVIATFMGLFLCIMAMFMTGSRAGVVVSLLGQMLAFLMAFRRDLSSRSRLAAALLGSAALALVLLQLMGTAASDRLEVQGLADGGRFETYKATMRMILDHPWFGTGLGTFGLAYPAYRSSTIYMWGVWDRAHSTPIEIAAEMGLPLACLVFLGWIVVLIVLMSGACCRRRDIIYPVAALCVALLSTGHSLIDFSLQIPGYAIVAFTIIGVGLAQSLKSRNVAAAC